MAADINASMQSEEPLLTIEELAAILQVPVSWVYSRTRRRGPGTIPCVRLGKYIRLRLSEVLAWAKAQEQA